MKTKDIENKIKKLQEEAEATKALEKFLPKSIPEPYSTCWHNSSLCAWSFSYHADPVESVLDIIDKWKKYILPLELQKGTFTSFRTPEHKQERGVNTVEEVFPVTVKISQYGIEFEFYAKIKGLIISVSIGTKLFNLARVTWRNQSNRYGDKWVSDVFCNLDGFYHNNRPIKWASGGNEYPNSFTLYWKKGEIEEPEQMFDSTLPSAYPQG